MIGVSVDILQVAFVIVVLLNVPTCMIAGIMIGLSRPFRSVRLNAAVALLVLATALSQVSTLYATGRLGIDQISPMSVLFRVGILAGAVGVVIEAWRVRDVSEWGRIPEQPTGAHHGHTTE